jgi:hypothetical protein
MARRVLLFCRLNHFDPRRIQNRIRVIAPVSTLETNVLRFGNCRRRIARSIVLTCPPPDQLRSVRECPLTEIAHRLRQRQQTGREHAVVIGDENVHSRVTPMTGRQTG